MQACPPKVQDKAPCNCQHLVPCISVPLNIHFTPQSTGGWSSHSCKVWDIGSTSCLKGWFVFGFLLSWEVHWLQGYSIISLVFTFPTSLFPQCRNPCHVAQVFLQNCSFGDLTFLWDLPLYFSFLVQFRWCQCKWGQGMLQSESSCCMIQVRPGGSVGLENSQTSSSSMKYYNGRFSTSFSLQLAFCGKDSSGILVLLTQPVCPYAHMVLKVSVNMWAMGLQFKLLF